MPYIDRGYRFYRRNIREHRKVYEDHFGKIPDGFLIHHINGNKLDNRIKNLLLVRNNSEHIKIYHPKKPRLKRLFNKKELGFIKNRITLPMQT